MRGADARALARDSACGDCYLGLGVYQYGLGRASALARLVAKLVGLGKGDAACGIGYLRRAAREGDLSKVEAEWVLAAALRREAARDPAARAAPEGAGRGRGSCGEGRSGGGAPRGAGARGGPRPRCPSRARARSPGLRDAPRRPLPAESGLSAVPPRGPRLSAPTSAPRAGARAPYSRCSL